MMEPPRRGSAKAGSWASFGLVRSRDWRRGRFGRSYKVPPLLMSPSARSGRAANPDEKKAGADLRPWRSRALAVAPHAPRRLAAGLHVPGARAVRSVEAAGWQ